MFDPGLFVTPQFSPLGFSYGPGCFGPTPEKRRLDDIRVSLREPSCHGPETVYTIAMDVGKDKDKALLESLHLLFGTVVFASGKLGEEPIRSQGHVHAISPVSGTSTPELYEIWSGRAVIYEQEFDKDDPGRCFAVEAGPGEVVLVPPGWAHCTISADSTQPLAFGAWCVREYGFVYDGVRAHGGLAYFPIWQGNTLVFETNIQYQESQLVRKSPRKYTEFHLEPDLPIYTQFEKDPQRFRFVVHPEEYEDIWRAFVP